MKMEITLNINVPDKNVEEYNLTDPKNVLRMLCERTTPHKDTFVVSTPYSCRKICDVLISSKVLN